MKMSLPVFVPPNILLYFFGIEVLFVAEKGNSCGLGIVRSADERHTKIVEVRDKAHPDTPLLHYTDDEIAPNFSLDVNNVDTGGISLWTAPDGNTANHDDDFANVVDFESHRIYDERVHVELSGFSSFFRMTNVNDALFFTCLNSSDGLLKKERFRPGSTTGLGSVAVVIGANIPLNRSGAVFVHGKDSIDLSPDGGKTYEIIVGYGHPGDVPDPPPNDSVYYDQVITGGAVSGKKIDFALDRQTQERKSHTTRSQKQLLRHLLGTTDPTSDPIPIIIPHAICFTGVIPRPSAIPSLKG
jgi:hypothetical protein